LEDTNIFIVRFYFDESPFADFDEMVDYFSRGYTGHEHMDMFGLINMNGRMYDPIIGRMLSPDPYVPNGTYTQDFNRYMYARNNPLSYVDPDGEFITWSISKSGISIGVNFTPIGIMVGGGINIGWSDGGSVGVYGELGPRFGGEGFGSGATVSQSLDYGFKFKSWSTTSSANVYASYGGFNAGANVSYTHGTSSNPGMWNWSVSAGVGIGNDEAGIGFNVGYGSQGWTWGLGGYYNPGAWKDNPIYDPAKWNDPDMINYNNCYSYALDDFNNGNWHGMQPGDYSDGPGITSREHLTLDNVLSLAVRDGRVKQPNFWNKLGFGKNGYYTVYLVSADGVDYHWYRQDQGGGWSHKPGRTAVRNTDFGGRPIISMNPVFMNHGIYQNGGIRLWVRRR